MGISAALQNTIEQGIHTGLSKFNKKYRNFYLVDEEDLIQEKIVAFLDNAEDDIVECILISLSDQLHGVVYPVEESKVDN